MGNVHLAASMLMNAAAGKAAVNEVICLIPIGVQTKKSDTFIADITKSSHLLLIL